MNSLFNLEGKLYQLLSKLAQLMRVNILTLLCSLPVITIGAAATAMQKLVYQIYRGEEGEITKTFFRTFAGNFRQATILWGIYLGFFLIVGVDLPVIGNLPAATRGWLTWVVLIFALMGLLSFTWVFVLQSRYHNTVWGTIRLSFVVWISHPLRTLVMLVMGLLPHLLLIAYANFLPLFLFLGISVSGICQATMYHSVFQTLETQQESV